MSEAYLNSHSLRPARAADEPFLQALYASTRAAELAAWGWAEAQQNIFLDLQFRAQQQHYAAYPNTAHWIIEAPAGATTQPIGRLLIARLTDEIRLVDIALLPDFRNRGIGAELVREVQAEASQNQQAVRLHVAADSPARSFYTRLGFYLLEDRGAHWFMEWRDATNTDQRNATDHVG
jgi:ribosomal protein S18 acetylase RimI-like enzyme